MKGRSRTRKCRPRKDYPHQSLQCSWPRDFAKRREFNRQAENKPYMQWLQDDFTDGDDNSSEDGGGNKEDDQEDESDLDDEDHSSEDEDDDDENRVQEKGGQLYDRCRNVRRFMKGMRDDEDMLKSLNEVEQVAKFCKQPEVDLRPTKPGKNSHLSLLLDYRSKQGTSAQKKGDCELDLGPLNSQQLLEQLSKPRFRINVGQNSRSNVFEEGECDVERRIIFITDPDASSIEALATTASRNQAPALKDFFYKYIAGKSSLGVTIPSQGYRTFTLEFHIPHYVLEPSKESVKDHRKAYDGRPLRDFWPLPFLSKPMTQAASTKTPSEVYFLYEVQWSVVVTGIDDFVWTAYGLIDTYVGSKESVRRYHRLRCQGRPGRPDPLAAGQIDAGKLIWTPREYFMRVVEIRTGLVQKQWNNILEVVEYSVKQSRTNRIYPISSSDPITRRKLREFIMWNERMVALLRQLSGGLSDTIRAWENFKQTDLGYFLYEDQSGTCTSSHSSRLDAIHKAFRGLDSLRKKLQEFEKELYQDNPQGVHAHLSLENNESAIFQRRTASHVEVLTAITILFYPLALAASLFSTTGVLPFTPNLRKFIYVMIILGVLLLATLLICFNWTSWLKPRVKRWIAELLAPKPTTDIGHKPDEEDFRDAATSKTSFKRNYLPRGLLKADSWTREDLEKGTEKEKDDRRRTRHGTV